VHAGSVWSPRTGPTSPPPRSATAARRDPRQGPGEDHRETAHALNNPPASWARPPPDEAEEIHSRPPPSASASSALSTACVATSLYNPAPAYRQRAGRCRGLPTAPPSPASSTPMMFVYRTLTKLGRVAAARSDPTRREALPRGHGSHRHLCADSPQTDFSFRPAELQGAAAR
jgi:hypothetical protein